jgi:hypothetical protein
MKGSFCLLRKRGVKNREDISWRTLVEVKLDVSTSSPFFTRGERNLFTEDCTSPPNPRRSDERKEAEEAICGGLCWRCFGREMGFGR